METSIKKVGIIISILAVIILALVGCFCATNVNGGKNELVLKNDKIMIAADREYILSGSNEEMASIWNSSLEESLNNHSHIKLTLMNDWIAEDSVGNSTIFGVGIGFVAGAIVIPEGVEITLDLNGYNIDKNLSDKNIADESKANSIIIGVYGTFNLMDSGYDISEVNGVYATYKDQDAEAENRVLLEKMSQINCGKITGNEVYVGAGGIYITGTFNMYGGMIVGNTTKTGSTAGVRLEGETSIFNLYNGLILGNKGELAGGIYCSHGAVNIFGGIITENICTGTKDSAGGVNILGTKSSFDMQSGIISHNKCAGKGGGLSLDSCKSANLQNCYIENNYGVENGGAVFINYVKYVNAQVVKIRNNVSQKHSIYLKNVANANVRSFEVSSNKSYDGVGGLAFYATLDNHSSFVMQSSSIIGNVTQSENKAYSAGLFIVTDIPGTMSVTLGGTKIIKNTANAGAGGISMSGVPSFRVTNDSVCSENFNTSGESNVYLSAKQKIDIIRLTNSRIGVTLSKDYGELPFTSNYNALYSAANPNNYFYSDNTEFAMETDEYKEVKLSNTIKKNTTKIEWSLLNLDNGEVIKTTYDTITTTYNEKGYILTNNVGEFLVNGVVVESMDVTNRGGYLVSMTDEKKNIYLNHTLMVYVLAKQVDVIWSNTDLIYNGTAQLPTAHIAEDDTCKISLVGAQTNVGNGYVVTATALSNNNYIMNPLSQNAKFNINKADLQVNIMTNDFIKEYNGKNIVLPNDWYTMSAELLGQDINKTLDIIYNIDYKAFIPQFNGNESAVEVGEYTISTKPFTASEVFKDNLNYNVTINYVNTGKLTITNPSVIRPTDNSGYDFMILQNNKRVSYKEKELIHGDNDSEYTNFVLGNIAPNTSVQTLLNNISFDTTLITIYNGANEVVYGENAKAFYTKDIDNGTELAVGTGWYIRYEKLTGGEETIYLSVLGDLTGDGKVNSADVNCLRQMVNNSEVYTNSSEVVKLSSLIINNGKTPTNADAEILWNVVCGKIDMSDFI